MGPRLMSGNTRATHLSACCPLVQIPGCPGTAAGHGWQGHDQQHLNDARLDHSSMSELHHAMIGLGCKRR